jgi:hypothetical protein
MFIAYNFRKIGNILTFECAEGVSEATHFAFFGHFWAHGDYFEAYGGTCGPQTGEFSGENRFATVIPREREFLL